MLTVFSIDVEKLAFGGAGVGRHEGKVAFVTGAFPGDRVLARVTKEHPRFIEASVVKIEVPSPHRRPPECPYTDDCGGCPWMAFDYAQQLEAKRSGVEEQFLHIAKIKADVSPCIAPPAVTGYRGRVKLRAGIGPDGGLMLGYHRSRTNDIVNIERCLIASDGINRIIAELRPFLAARAEIVPSIAEIVIETGYPAALGRLRMVMDALPDEDFTDALLAAVPGAAALSVVSGHEMDVWGEADLSVNVGGGLELIYGPASFSQVNPSANRMLVEKAVRRAQPAKGKTALDLYCGMGNISLPLAAAGMRVTGVEHSTDAIDDARSNAARLGLEAEFIEGDAIHTARHLAREKKRFDTVLLDPPRSGARGIGQWLNQLAKERVVYVSCDPPSLARDAKEIVESGFRLVSVEPLDMFPQTFHVETIALFERRA